MVVLAGVLLLEQKVTDARTVPQIVSLFVPFVGSWLWALSGGRDPQSVRVILFAPAFVVLGGKNLKRSAGE